jgi:glycosyltransferase involved in cell wall biosynthesis
MQIAFTHPFCWPFVRRGNERNIDVMGRYFTAGGHQVTTVSTRPGPRAVEHDLRGTRILAPPLNLPGMALLNVNEMHTFFLTALRELRQLEVDLVHSLSFTDALAASALSGRRRFATVFQMNGMATPGLSCRRFPPEAAMYRRALRSADAVITCSEYIRGLVREHFGVDSFVIPPMVDVEAFTVARPPAASHPILLAAGDFTEPRKGIRALLRAFPLVKRQVPELVLNLSGRVPERLVAELTGSLPDRVREDIRILGLGRPEDLPRLYSEATLLVLPAMGEPSGTVLMEAWSAGTPVVTTDHGGVPEFVDPSVGVLFEPRSKGLETENAEGLAAAIVDGLELAQRPQTEAACRARARDFAGACIGPRIEAVYRSIC